MRLGAGGDPRVEERLRGVSGSCGYEFVGRLTKRTVCTEGDRPEAYVEPLLVDDLRGTAVLGGGVGVGARSTNCARIWNFKVHVPILGSWGVRGGSPRVMSAAGKIFSRF